MSYANLWLTSRGGPTDTSAPQVQIVCLDFYDDEMTKLPNVSRLTGALIARRISKILNFWQLWIESLLIFWIEIESYATKYGYWKPARNGYTRLSESCEFISRLSTIASNFVQARLGKKKSQ